jgi:hypothetical protein
LLWRQSAKILPQSAAALGAWIDRVSLDASDEVSGSLSNPPLTIGWIAQTAVPAADVQAFDENAAEPAAYLADAAFCPALAANVRSECWSIATCKCESSHLKLEEGCACMSSVLTQQFIDATGASIVERIECLLVVKLACRLLSPSVRARLPTG